MQATDVPEVKALEDVLFPVDAWTHEMFHNELAEVGISREVMVARLAGQIVGYVSFRFVGDEGDVVTIAVDASVQKQGVGTLMMDWLETTAKVRGVTNLFLEVRSDNIPAIAMYLARDFERINLRRNYYDTGVDAYVMRKRLNHV
ncbi:MAG: ribosomal protein S18-alanine N-acetyltransferase [Actinobacteria bacterium]|nr:ribosomal protein S18-alanine N-acetyltransferase [Actinomycetota bacterium]